jgi:hypothetical protein
VFGVKFGNHAKKKKRKRRKGKEEKEKKKRKRRKGKENDSCTLLCEALRANAIFVGLSQTSQARMPVPLKS